VEGLGCDAAGVIHGHQERMAKLDLENSITTDGAEAPENNDEQLKIQEDKKQRIRTH